MEYRRCAEARRGAEMPRRGSGVELSSKSFYLPQFRILMDVPNLTDITLETLDLGAQLRGDVCRFRVWAPKAKQVTLRLGERELRMRPAESEYFEFEERAKAGDRYFYVVDGQKPVPDP